MTSLVPPSDTDPLLLPAQLEAERAHDAEADRADTGTEPLWRRFAHDRLAVGALVFLVVLIGLAIAAPLVAPYRPDAQDLNAINAGPSAAHWFGTDDLGRDILSRLIWGARVSLRAAFEIVILAIIVALPIGLIAGTVRGWFDSLVMRLMDALFSFPPLVLALTVAALLGPNLNDAAVAIAVVFVPSFVRLIRGEVISVREETYIESSQALGASPSRLIRSHIFPNVASPIVIQVALALGFALLAEAGLSFLGVGEQPPTASWGTMLSEAYQFIFTNPLALVFPGLAIMVTVLSFNLVADGLRDALGRERAVSPKAAGRAVRRLRAGVRRRWEGIRPTTGPAATPGATVAAGPTTATVSTPPAAGELLSVRGVQVEFAMDGEWVPVVEDVSFSVLPGQTVGLVGESGSGKTVSALALMGLLPPGARLASGSVHLDGRELTTMTDRELQKLRGNDVAMIFQEPMTSLNPAYSVGNQIAEQIRVHRGLSRKESWRAAVEMLDRVEIPNAATRARQYPHLFSGGMRQRVMIAMALSCSPKLLIADEPTTALDVTTQAQIIDLLRTLLEEQDMSMIFVTHDLGVIADVADQVVVMYAGQVVEQAEVHRLYARPRHPYTEALMTSIPQLTPRGEQLHTIPGVVPRPTEFTPSCRFVLRCDHAAGGCASTPTRLEAASGSGGGQVPAHLSRCIRQDELVLRSGPEGVTTRVQLRSVPEPTRTPYPILQTTDLRKEFPIRSGVLRTVSGSVSAVDGVNLSIGGGTTLGLVGESGSGKSTLARLVMRLVEPTSGSVVIDGTDLTALSGAALREHRHLMQMVFQDPYSSLDPRHTISDTVAEPLRTHSDLPPADIDARVLELLVRVGMGRSALRRYPHQFSGGQRQRIAIARALAVDPKLLVCDEAVSALDVSTQAQVINLLRDLQQSLGTSYLFIAHDLSVVRHISDRIAVMYLGRVVEEGPAEAVYRQPAHPYTAALLSAIPVPDPVGRETRRRVVLRGEVGGATAGREAGCPFRSRCAYAMDICGQVDPEPYLTPAGTTVRCHLHTQGPALGGESVVSLDTATAST